MDIDPQKIITNPLFPGLLGACIGLRFAPGVNWLFNDPYHCQHSFESERRKSDALPTKPADAGFYV